MENQRYFAMSLQILQNLQYHQSRFFVRPYGKFVQITSSKGRCTDFTIQFNGNCKIYKFGVFSSKLSVNLSQFFSLRYVKKNTPSMRGCGCKGSKPCIKFGLQQGRHARYEYASSTSSTPNNFEHPKR